MLNHDDMCRLSRVFTATSDLRTAQDQRINEWLKEQIALSISAAPSAPSVDGGDEQDQFDKDADEISAEVCHIPEVASLPDLCDEDLWPHVERALVAVGRHFRRSKSNG